MTLRRALVPIVLAMLALVTLAATAAPADALDEDGTTTTSALVRSDPDSPLNNILPRPGSGAAPDSPNDPGGWQQYLVFGLIVVGIAAIVGLVVRESRRARLSAGRGDEGA